MDNLSNSIYTYYIEHFAELPISTKLHFASRLWLWNTDPVARGLLDQSRSEVIKSENAEDVLRALSSGTLVSIGKGTATAQAIRAPYVKRYPQLRNISATLYWAALLDAVYGTDLRSAIDKVFDLGVLHDLYNQLLHDNAALAILSTHAVNFLYLCATYLKQTEIPNPEHFLRLVVDEHIYDVTDHRQTQLAIYLLTHSIIGETGFYVRAISPERLPAYRQQIQALENLMHTDFASVHLDNKFEFLVCCRLTGYNSSLKADIFSEAARSVSTHGDFLVDTLNTNADSPYASFEKSEHRNSLFLLATTEPQLALQAL